MTVEYTNTEIQLGFNAHTYGDLTASGDTALTVGTVLGRISATGKLVVMASASTDGSQYPVGVVIADQTILDGETKRVNLVNKGTIDASLLVFDGTDDLDTAVGVASNQKTYRDWLNDLGLELKAVTELTDFDNA